MKKRFLLSLFSNVFFFFLLGFAACGSGSSSSSSDSTANILTAPLADQQAVLAILSQTGSSSPSGSPLVLQNSKNKNHFSIPFIRSAYATASSLACAGGGSVSIDAPNLPDPVGGVTTLSNYSQAATYNACIVDAITGCSFGYQLDGADNSVTNGTIQISPLTYDLHSSVTTAGSCNGMIVDVISTSASNPQHFGMNLTTVLSGGVGTAPQISGTICINSSGTTNTTYLIHNDTAANLKAILCGSH